MEKHPNQVVGFNGTLEDLARNIGNMSYNQTSFFLEKLAEDFIRQADADKNRGRIKLSSELYVTAQRIYDVKNSMDIVWKICEPYMKK